MLALGVLAMVACLGAAAPWSLAHGALFTAIGLLMGIYPPSRKHPVLWTWLAGLWVICSTLFFLPHSLFGGSQFSQLAQVGIRIPNTMTPQPADAAIKTASMTAAGIIALWTLGHSLSAEKRMRVAVVMIALATLLTTADWLLRKLGYPVASLSEFGFFPNRNHGATFVSMGALVSLGVLVQSLHLKWRGTAVLSLVCIAWLSGSLVFRSQSRSSLLLVPLAILLWYWAIDRKRYLRGNAGKASMLLLLALILGFATSGGALQQRLQWHTPPAIAEKHRSSHSAAFIDEDKPFDGRIDIWRDSLGMISAMPWTGCGAGQFSFVFPQFNRESQDSRGSEALHPESSWLWIAAEYGLPAVISLAALVTCVFSRILRYLKNERSRHQALRAACLAAAFIPFLHALFDVSPHRVGILWFSGVLAALALPDQRHEAGKRSRIGWRLVGASICILGMLLLHGYFLERSLSNAEHAQWLTHKAESTYLRELHNRTDFSSDTSLADPLETALSQLESAVKLTPMDSHAHGLRGMLALHFDDKDALAKQAFAAQRALNPNWVELPAMQGDAWSKINPAETTELWREAVQRAKRLEPDHLGRKRLDSLRRRFEKTAGTDPMLRDAARTALAVTDS